MTESEQETKDLSPEVIENHKQLIERDNQNKAGLTTKRSQICTGAIFAAGRAGSEIGTGKGRFMTQWLPM